MHKLNIRHQPGPGGPAFMVERPGDRAFGPFPITPPLGFPVPGSGNADLTRELQWYLEDFLDYPYPPATDRADRLLAALRDWGRGAFDALFDHRDAAVLLDRARRDGYGQLLVQVWSDDAAVLQWPWEALLDRDATYLALACQIERRLNTTPPPLDLPASLPRDRINVLLVTARPYRDDVRYRSISRSLLELIEKEDLPVSVHLLRPPTFAALRQRLAERPGFYHILHFDGHGGYCAATHPNDHQHCFAAAEGCLLFETDDGKEDLISASQLRDLLRDHPVPVTALNAYRSAMISPDAPEPFASTATALLHSGCRAVTAMSYSLYVSAARLFVPEFYRRLFATGNVAQAVRAGRQKLREQPGRICARGRHDLADWMIPVLYQQEDFNLPFIKQPQPSQRPERPELPEDASDRQNPYGFIGRDDQILELERGLRGQAPAILIHGLAGVGKTTLARGLVHWLAQTDGLGAGCIWLRFGDERNAEYVINRMAEQLFPSEFLVLPLDQKIELLARALHDHKLLVVWDNFEVVAGNPDAGVPPNLPAADQAAIHGFLKKLWNGKTKVIITSRSLEDWLGTDRRLLSCPGLDGEERWEFCDLILDNLGVNANRAEPDFKRLMDFLAGHPLAMRVILPRLEQLSARQVLAALQSNLEALGLPASEDRAKLFAALQFAQDRVPPELKPLLIPLSMHERFFQADMLKFIAARVDPAWTEARITALIQTLAASGLIWNIVGPAYEMHPALSGFLRSKSVSGSDPTALDAWISAFVEVMAMLAEGLAPLELHEQRLGFHLHGPNFRHALAEAERMGEELPQRALIQSLASFAENTRRFDEAEMLYSRLVELRRQAGDEEAEASAYHQLGMVAQGRRDFEAAEKWYRKSLAIKEKLGYEHGEASTYHQLGIVALERRDFEAAEKWYLKSLEIKEKLGNVQGAANAYHQLGRVAQERHDFEVAEKWYLKSLEIKEKLGNEHGAAATYFQVGRVAQERHDFEAAEKWYLKALAIFEKLGDEQNAATTYHQLGRVAQERHDFEVAEKWYLKALSIEEKLCNEHGEAMCYHQLGIVAQERRDFETAEKWYMKALAIKERLGDEHGAASTYWQLGQLYTFQHRFKEGGKWLIESIMAYKNTADPERVRQGLRIFPILYRSADASTRAVLRGLWTTSGLGPFPEGEGD